MRRIVIFGASGSGKSTLGRWLAAQLGTPFTDLDDLQWQPGWIETPAAQFRAAVAQAALSDSWVIAGNYGHARDLLWPRADTLIWLDLPLARVLWRSFVRALQDWHTGRKICNGNRQRLWMIVNGRDSLLGYNLRTYHRRRREWPAALRLPQHAHATVIRLRTPAEVATWMQHVRVGGESAQAPG
jgi:adenylate kinase family enzyme